MTRSTKPADMTPPAQGEPDAPECIGADTPPWHRKGCIHGYKWASECPKCEKCGAPAVGGPCVLLAEHNRGQIDIPSNHQAAQGEPPQDFDELLQRLDQWSDESDKYCFAADAAKAIRELRHDAAAFFVDKLDLERTVAGLRASLQAADQEIERLRAEIITADGLATLRQNQRLKAEQQLAEEKARKRPWSPEHTKSVIDGQVNEMDRQTGVIQALREQLAEREARMAALMNMVKWSVKHEGECLGDHPELLELARDFIERAERADKGEGK